jgi:hypothetical protein
MLSHYIFSTYGGRLWLLVPTLVEGQKKTNSL